MLKPELLSPAGNFESLKLAVQNGSDAVYLAGKRFGARAFSNNFNEEELIDAIKYCHLYGVKVYITINTIIYEEEIDEFLNYVRFLHINNVDAVITQDIGMATLIHKIFPNLILHASTQMNISDIDSLKFLKNIGFKRVVLARETPLDVIKIMKREVDIELEVFIHGALCISCSGECLISYFKNGRSANRGKCAQLCRLPYDLYKNGKKIKLKDKYLLSPKDLCTLDKIDELIDSGIDSFKIEGRMKSKEYVGFVTRVYRNKIDTLDSNSDDIENMKKLFNREFTLGHLYNKKAKELINGYRPNHIGILIGNVIDKKRGKIKIKLINSLNQGDAIRICSKREIGFYVNKLYKDNLLVNSANNKDIIEVESDQNIEINSNVYKTIDIKLNNYINKSSIKMRKVPLKGSFNAHNGGIVFEVSDGTNNEKITLYNCVYEAKNKPTSKDEIKEKLNKLGNEVFIFDSLNINIDQNVFIPMTTINNLRRNIIKLIENDRTKVNSKIIEKDYVFDKINIDDNSNIYFDIQNEKQLTYILENTSYSCYVSDRLLFNKYKNNDRVIDKNLVINKYKDLKTGVITDSNFNVVNSYSVYFLHNMGAKRVTLSYELNENQIEKIYNSFIKRYNVKPSLEVIVYGKPEVMLSKYCVLNTYLGNGTKTGCNICKFDNYYLMDSNNNKYKIKKSADCFMHILNYKNINLIDKINDYKKIGINNFRIILDEEDEFEIKNIISSLKNSKVIL